MSPSLPPRGGGALLGLRGISQAAGVEGVYAAAAKSSPPVLRGSVLLSEASLTGVQIATVCYVATFIVDIERVHIKTVNKDLTVASVSFVTGIGDLVLERLLVTPYTCCSCSKGKWDVLIEGY